MSLLHIGIAAGIVLLLWVVVCFNSLVRARSHVDEAWSGVEVQLARRHDVVPNLVETVRAYSEHEARLLRDLTEARENALAVHSCGRRELAETDLSRMLAAVRALAEQYPQLRASESHLRLQAQLAEVEGEIQAARRIYNANVQRYNARLQSFPTSLVGVLAFRPRRYFDLVMMPRPAAREAVFA
jgi:LemA protein